MKILFFDLEFADSRVPGSIYSMGYVVTDESLLPLEEARDLLINPATGWHEYVKEHILAYPVEEVEAAPCFDERYGEISRLFSEADLVVGFAIGNDNHALRKACERYGLPMPVYRWLDMERLCRQLPRHRDARGLAGCVRAWCGFDPDHRHRSDGDAEATRMLFARIAAYLHATPEMFPIAYPDCAGNTGEQKKKKSSSRRRYSGARGQKRQNFRKQDNSQKKKAEID